MADLHFELVTPEKLLRSEDVHMVVVPGTEGDFGVMAGHAPYMSTLARRRARHLPRLAAASPSGSRSRAASPRSARTASPCWRRRREALIRAGLIPADPRGAFCERHSSSPPAMIKAAPAKVERSGAAAEQQPAETRRHQQLDIGHRRHHRRRGAHRRRCRSADARPSPRPATPAFEHDAALGGGHLKLRRAGQASRRQRSPASAPR